MEAKIVYNLKEVMEITGLSRTTIWKAVQSGRLKKAQTGIRKLLFTQRALEEFLTNNNEDER